MKNCQKEKTAKGTIKTCLFNQQKHNWNTLTSADWEPS